MAPAQCYDHSDRDRILNHLFARTTAGIKLGLDRIEAAAAELGNPHRAFKSIHVAGTNGKGSACAFCDAILRAAGLKTGLYTSPHLIDFEERFRIAGRRVAVDRWLDAYREVEPLVERYGLTFFEAATLLAFSLFRQERVEWGIIETGLGGRLDATNIVLPEIAIVTRIGMDHMQYLGDSIESIAREKFGIVKPGVPLILGPQVDPAVARIAREICGARGAALIAVDQDDDDGLPGADAGSRLPPLPFPGACQIGNARCAATACMRAAGANSRAVMRGLQTARLSGRFQRFAHAGATVVLDVAHNPAAASCLTETLESEGVPRPVIFVAGIMADKDYGEMLAAYRRCGDGLILCRPAVSRAAATAQLAEAAGRLWGDNVMIHETVAEAVARGLAEAGQGTVCITGSFFTVGEAIRALGFDDPEQAHTAGE